MQPATFPTVVRAEPEDHHPLRPERPYGYMDWWPISLYVNNTVEPFNDPDVRWALSYYIEPPADHRRRLWRGAASFRPSCRCRQYPALQAVLRRGQGSARQVRHDRVRPEEGRRAAAGKGCKKGGDGIWVDATGQAAQVRDPRLRHVLSGDRPGASQQQLKRQGIDAA